MTIRQITVMCTNNTQINDTHKPHSASCYSKYHIYIVLLLIIILSVIMDSVIILNVLVPSKKRALSWIC
jgi:hypothetical protein